MPNCVELNLHLCMLAAICWILTGSFSSWNIRVFALNGPTWDERALSVLSFREKQQRQQKERVSSPSETREAVSQLALTNTSSWSSFLLNSKWVEESWSSVTVLWQNPSLLFCGARSKVWKQQLPLICHLMLECRNSSFDHTAWRTLEKSALVYF